MIIKNNIPFMETISTSSGRLIIGVTAKCNSNCTFCIFSDTKSLLGDLASGEIKKALNSFKNKYAHVGFTGGEPTLRPDIDELVRYAKHLGYKVELSTNGRLFVYKDFCKKMINAGVDIFFISLSAHNAQLYEALTLSRSSFSQVRAGLLNLIYFKQCVLTNTVITRSNYEALPKISRFLVDLGLKECQFTFGRKPCLTLGDVEYPNLRKSDVKVIVERTKQSIDIMTKAKRSVNLVLIPFCHMKGYEKHIKPYRSKYDKVIYLKVKKDLGRYPNIGEYVQFWKNEICNFCRYSSICEGIEVSSPFEPQAI